MYFLYPFVLFLLSIPLLYFFYGIRKPSHHFTRYFSKEVLKKLSISSGYMNHHIKQRLFLLILALFILALARPIKQLNYLDVSTKKASVIIAVDVSKSMHHTDIYPSRLTLAKAKLTHLVAQSKGLNIGILFYAKDAYVLYPLSQTPHLLSSLIQDINLTQHFAPNSNLFAALEGAETLLKGKKNKHIILLSDGGEDVTRNKELTYVKSKHITLWALATATKVNTSLRTLCQKTNGLYQPYSWGDEDIQTLLHTITRTKAKSQNYHYAVTQYKEYFSYPLSLAIVLLFLLFLPLKKPKNILLVLLLFIADFSTPIKANVFDFWYLHAAKKAYENKAYNDAITAYKKVDLTSEGYYNLASTYYKAEEYLVAIEYYKKALGQNKKLNAKIYYNIATAYARKRKLDLAKMYYEKSLKMYEYKVALDNLSTIKKQLKRERKNLHKKYKKLHFNAIGKNEYVQNSAFSNYAVKIHTFIPSEEEQWIKKVLSRKTSLYLQKLNTTKRSSDAYHPW